MANGTKGEIFVLPEQIVPSSACAVCEVCCRFPEADSPLRPYFTRDEIQLAIAAGVLPDAFPDHAGSKITLVPFGDGYRCPAFDPATSQCGIYRFRPLDCQLYPLAVMWDSTHQNVVMGWDTKCPFIVQNGEMPQSHAYVERMAQRLETESMARTVVENSQLVGAFQDDVIVLKRLTRITEGLRTGSGHVSATTTLSPFALQPLSLEDQGRFKTLMQEQLFAGDPLAAYSFPYHYIWRDLFSYEWAELAGHYCLFATNDAGTFLALPPLGPDPTGAAIVQAFEILAERNPVPAVSRIENVPEAVAESCRVQGYTVVPKEGDYVYRREDLVSLKGDRYKSQRASYNQCAKHAPLICTYSDGDFPACLKLFDQWRSGIKTAADDYSRYMAEDAVSAHRTALRHARELGLTGLLAYVEDKLVGYTFGYPLTHTLPPEGRGQGEGSVFCILLEITDRGVSGVSQYLFREFCRQLGEYDFINTMDDSGLDGLRKAKENYHPVRVVPNYTVRPAKQ
jgi:Fe-S-cluster containining protein